MQLPPLPPPLPLPSLALGASPPLAQLAYPLEWLQPWLAVRQQQHWQLSSMEQLWLGWPASKALPLPLPLHPHLLLHLPFLASPPQAWELLASAAWLAWTLLSWRPWQA